MELATESAEPTWLDLIICSGTAMLDLPLRYGIMILQRCHHACFYCVFEAPHIPTFATKNNQASRVHYLIMDVTTFWAHDSSHRLHLYYNMPINIYLFCKEILNRLVRINKYCLYCLSTSICNSRLPFKTSHKKLEV